MTRIVERMKTGSAAMVIGFRPTVTALVLRATSIEAMISSTALMTISIAAKITRNESFLVIFAALLVGAGTRLTDFARRPACVGLMLPCTKTMQTCFEAISAAFGWYPSAFARIWLGGKLALP